ncbi:beta-galactosidase [Kutzneria kofuensis]|uniref:Beta-galactosidase n=1 Tax=Kutzneria kofuensis TaxID=103725 RepID=A0A7W9KG21_9PSEU|nr:beta-galactosidase [Kutzneria kofuensis]MBB5891977.1 beta-galactosidase [Kutzneria kofuensis]
MTGWPTGLQGPGWGGDYNPEQWPEHVWTQDVELMKRAGVNLVSVGIFAWARIEVADNRFDFGWLDQILDQLHEGGIRVCLANATASPPPWLTSANPDMLPVRADGVRLSHGSRQAYCPTSPVYRDRAIALTEKIALRYGEHPALAAWHVNNEYGCHVSRCYCDRCAEVFRDWLRARYDLAGLNRAWGTDFWSQHYSSWEQVLPPRVTPTFQNPGQVLDFARFCSDALLDLFCAERDVLSDVTPDVPVTTNFMANWTFKALNYWHWAAEVDFVSNDHYTRAEDPERHIELALSADLVRGLSRGEPWLLMEHSTSAVNWQPRNFAKLAGELRRNSFSHLARGADGTLFFQWRQSRAGAERFHSAMLPHAGEDTKVFREVTQVGEEYQRLSELLGSTVDAQVALVYDFESAWAAEQPAHPTSDFDYYGTVLGVYRALWRVGVTVDVVPPSADLSGYRLVVAPSLYQVTDNEARWLEDYVRAGGHAVVTWFSGIADENSRVRLGGYPGAFRELLGVRVEEFFPLPVGDNVKLTGGLSATTWSELLHPNGCEVISSYVDGDLRGVPAVTRNVFGDGVAWYLATTLDPDSAVTMFADVLAGAGVEPVTTAPSGVEVVRRRGERISWLVAINHTGTDVVLPVEGVELISGVETSGGLPVPAGGVAVVREV